MFDENTQFDDVLFKRLRNHELGQTHPNKVFMYNEKDRPWDVLPGLYTCMTRKHRLDSEATSHIWHLTNHHRAALALPASSLCTIDRPSVALEVAFKLLAASRVLQERGLQILGRRF